MEPSDNRELPVVISEQVSSLDLRRKELLVEVETQTQKKVRNALLTTFAVLAFFAFVGGGVHAGLLFIGGIGGFLSWRSYVDNKKKFTQGALVQFRKSYRRDFLPAVVQTYYPHINYSPKRLFLADEFSKSGLIRAMTGAKNLAAFQYGCYGYFQHDTARGTLGMAFIKISSSAGSRIFEGVLFHAPIDQDLSGQTMLTPQHTRTLPKAKLFDLDEEIDAPLLAQRFNCYTSKYTHAHEAFSDKIIKFLESFSASNASHSYVSLTGGQIYLYINLGERYNPMRPSLDVTLWDEDQSKRMNFLVDILDRMRYLK